MSDTQPSMEERILKAVKLTLSRVIRDTATPPGMKHPLSDRTIEDLRQCLALISAREREIAQASGSSSPGRPRFADEPTAEPKVVKFHPRRGPKGDSGGR